MRCFWGRCVLSYLAGPAVLLCPCGSVMKKNHTRRPLALAMYLSLYNCMYWVVQARLLTPLTFAQHRLSPLAAFTSGAYFLHNGRR